MGVVFVALPGKSYTASSSVTYVLPLSSVNSLLRLGGGETVQRCSLRHPWQSDGATSGSLVLR